MELTYNIQHSIACKQNTSLARVATSVYTFTSGEMEIYTDCTDWSDWTDATVLLQLSWDMTFMWHVTSRQHNTTLSLLSLITHSLHTHRWDLLMPSVRTKPKLDSGFFRVFWSSLRCFPACCREDNTPVHPHKVRNSSAHKRFHHVGNHSQAMYGPHPKLSPYHRNN